MSRPLDSATSAALQTSPVYPAWFLRMDVQGDPIYLNTSLYDFTFPGGSGYDPAIVGFTFKGAGNIGQIDAVTDSIDGSQTLSVILPGVNMANDYLHQFLVNNDLWQRYPAYLWLATLNNAGAILGKPFRVKSARMDKLIVDIDPESGKGTITITLESQQAYSGESSNSRYIDQKQFIDSTDTSQDYVANLANQIPGLGSASTNTNANAVGMGQNVGATLQY
jgi:hypothetical protein